MNPLFITVATPEILRHTSEFLANQQDFCTARNITHFLYTDNPYPDLHPSFSKVHYLHRALQTDAPYVISADIDVAFMDYTWDPFQLVQSPYYLAAYHQRNWNNWPYLCAGLTIWRNCEEAKAFVASWLTRVESREIQFHPWEQWYFDELLRADDRVLKEGPKIIGYRNVRICEEHEIGCFCPTLWNDGIIWKPNYPTMHFAGPHPWPDRRAHLLQHLPSVRTSA